MACSLMAHNKKNSFYLQICLQIFIFMLYTVLKQNGATNNIRSVDTKVRRVVIFHFSPLQLTQSQDRQPFILHSNMQKLQSGVTCLWQTRTQNLQHIDTDIQHNWNKTTTNPTAETKTNVILQQQSSCSSCSYHFWLSCCHLSSSSTHGTEKSRPPANESSNILSLYSLCVVTVRSENLNAKCQLLACLPSWQAYTKVGAGNRRATSTFTEVHLIVDFESLQPRHETTERVAQTANIPSPPYSVTIQNRRRPATSRAPQTLRRITSLAATSTPTQNRQRSCQSANSHFHQNQP